MLDKTQLKGFTLIELLVVIAILAVLAVAVVLVLNPAELIKQGRDSTRISDLAALNSAIALYVADVRNPTWPGATCYSTATTSLTGSGVACGSYISTSTAVDGTGWVKINLNLISSGSPLSKLPIDPNNNVLGCWGSGGANTLTCGYIFSASSTVGVYEIDAAMESAKYGSPTGAANVTATDNGNNSYEYEVGSNLNLIN